MDGKSERLEKRKKPMRPKLKRLHERAIIIDKETVKDGPVRLSAEHQDGRYVVKLESICPPDCQPVSAQPETNLTTAPPKE